MATQSTRITLHTRHGTRPNRSTFDTCKWFLPDAVMAPSNDHTLYADVTFVSIPSDHKRINFQRGTNLLLFEKRSRLSGRTYERTAVIMAGDYTREGIIGAFQRAINIADEMDEEDDAGNLITPPVRGTTSTTMILRLASEFDIDYNNVHGLEIENVVLSTTNPKYDYRIVVNGCDNGPEVLGIHDTTGWCDHENVHQIANSVIDVHGTRTVTINAMGLGGNHTDIVDRFRRRCVLRTIPVIPSNEHKMCVWERMAGKDGHSIATRCLTSLELSLWDDMGFPFDPRHHWTIGLEIYALKNQHFNYSM